MENFLDLGNFGNKIKKETEFSVIETIDELKETMKSKYPNIEFDFGGLNKESTSDVVVIVKQLDKHMSDYPDVAGKLEYVGTEPREGGLWGKNMKYMKTGASGKNLMLNPFYLNNPKLTYKRIQNAKKKGYRPITHILVIDSK